MARRTDNNFKLPEPIGEETHFVWGPVITVHAIGRYKIVEFRPQIYKNGTGTGHYAVNYSRYHPYVDDKDTNTSCDTLDQALITAIAVRRHGWADACNGRYVTHVCRLLRIGSAMYYRVDHGGAELSQLEGHVLRYCGDDPKDVNRVLLQPVGEQNPVSLHKDDVTVI